MLRKFRKMRKRKQRYTQLVLGLSGRQQEKRIQNSCGRLRFAFWKKGMLVIFVLRRESKGPGQHWEVWRKAMGGVRRRGIKPASGRQAMEVEKGNVDV